MSDGQVQNSILSSLWAEMKLLNSAVNDFTNVSQEDLLYQLRYHTQKLETPKKHLQQSQYVHNSIDQTILIENKRTQDYYSAIGQVIERRTPKRMIKQRPYKSLVKNIPSQQQQPEELLQPLDISQTQQQKRTWYISYFIEYAKSHGQSLKQQIKQLTQEYKKLLPQPQKNERVQVQQFKQQMHICKLRDKIVKQVFLKKLQSDTIYYKTINEQIDQLEQYERRTQMKSILELWQMKAKEQRQENQFVEELQGHLSQFKMRGLFSMLVENVQINRNIKHQLQRCILKSYIKRWIEFKVSQFFLEQKLRRRELYLNKLINIFDKAQIRKAFSAIIQQQRIYRHLQDPFEAIVIEPLNNSIDLIVHTQKSSTHQSRKVSQHIPQQTQQTQQSRNNSNVISDQFDVRQQKSVSITKPPLQQPSVVSKKQKNRQKERKEEEELGGFFKVWKQFTQIKRLGGIIDELYKQKVQKKVLKAWRKQRSRAQNTRMQYFFKAWKKISQSKLKQLIADNYLRSQIVVKTFTSWHVSFRRRKALHIFERIQPKHMQKNAFSIWRKNARVEQRQLLLFQKIQQQKLVFRYKKWLKVELSINLSQTTKLINSQNFFVDRSYFVLGSMPTDNKCTQSKNFNINKGQRLYLRD